MICEVRSLYSISYIYTHPAYLLSSSTKRIFAVSLTLLICLYIIGDTRGFLISNMKGIAG